MNPLWNAAIAIGTIGICTVIAGCSGGRLQIDADIVTASDGTASNTVWADWDDLGGSIGSGFTVAESAVLDTASSDDRLTWSIITIDNYTGLVTASRDVNAQRDSRGCEQITVSARVDGDKGKARAAMIISGATERLKQLAGVEWAPRR